MQLAKVQGRVTATILHESLAGRTLLLCQPLGIELQPNGDPLIVMDQLGAGKGDVVTICSDGKSKRKKIGRDDCPARWMTLGIVENL